MADRHLVPTAAPAAAPGAARRSLLRICFIAGRAWGFHMVSGWSHAVVEAGGGVAELMPAMLVGLLALYGLLIALPFVPGVEIGGALLMAEGPPIAPWVYLATLLGLTFAFAVGALIPSAMLPRLLSDLRLTGPRRMLERLEPLDGDARLAVLTATAPRWQGQRPARRRRGDPVSCRVQPPVLTAADHRHAGTRGGAGSAARLGPRVGRGGLVALRRLCGVAIARQSRSRRPRRRIWG